jgi:STE24 endopeptidase
VSAAESEAGATRASWIMLLVGAAVATALAVALIPWHPYPGGALQVPHASDYFTPDQLARIQAYSHPARWLSRSDLAVSVIVACLLGFTRARGWIARRLRGPWWLRALEAVAVVTVVGWIVTLPFGIALQHHQRAFGLSDQAWGSWLADQGLGLLVTVVAASIAVVALLACTRRFPRSWPLVAGAVLAVLVVLGSFVYPLLVQPLFNTFKPLPDGDLRTQILAIADREGVHVDDVLVTDASRRTTTLNAYVTGFGPSRRVVLYDNLVDELPRDQVLSVVAHELAHAKHDDVLVGTAIGAGVALAAVGLLGVLLGRRFDRLTDPGAVPTLLALFTLASVLALPVQNVMSRAVETRADVTALRTTGDKAAFESLQVRLALGALQDPDPPAVSQAWFGTHPTALQRIALAERILR